MYTCLHCGRHRYKQVWRSFQVFKATIFPASRFILYGGVEGGLVWWSESSFGGTREGGKGWRKDWRRDRAVRTRLFYLRFAVIGLCVDAVVAVHFDLNRIRLERLFSIFFLQRQLPVRGAKRKKTRLKKKAWQGNGENTTTKKKKYIYILKYTIHNTLWFLFVCFKRSMTFRTLIQ